MSSRNRRRRLSRLNPFRRRDEKPAARLARGAEMNPQMVEQLEARQMLFTHVMGPGDPIDPGTGLREFTRTFGYAIPYLVPTAVGTAADITRLEDFNTDDPGDPGPTANGIGVPSGFVFQESVLKIEYTASLVRLVRENLPEQGPNLLRVSMQPGEFISFGIAMGEEAPASSYYVALKDLVSPPFSQRSMRMDLGPTFNPDDVIVDLLYEGTSVQSFTGPALLALSGALPNGARQYIFRPPAGLAFDQVRITAINAASFTVDNVSTVIPPANNATGVDKHSQWAVTLTFVAPIGATIQVLDLYGREMRDTIQIRIPDGADPGIPLIDRDDDGVPDFNDGLGRVIMTGTNSLSRLLLNGATVEPIQDAIPPGTIRLEPPNAPAFAAFGAVGSLFDDFEEAGYGFAVGTGGAAQGLPEGPGQVILGAPWVRPNANAQTYGANPPAFATQVSGTNFNRGDQGIKLLDGSPINSVVINGIAHGVSQFNSFVNSFSVGYMMGSLSVQSDLGSFTSGSDAGIWATDDGGPPVSIGAFLIVGRTFGTFDVAGRNGMTITVLGDLARPPRNTTGVFYDERESQNIPFGPGVMANDTILSAEFVGSSATAVTIRGVNTGSAADPSDVYVFPVTGDQDIVIQTPNTLAYLRIMDQDGRTLSATQANNPIGLNRGFNTLRYRPLSPGVLYLDVQSVGGYQININGIGATTFGSFRTGAGLPTNPNIQLLNGDMGMIRVGGSFIDTTQDGRPEADPSVVINEGGDEDIDARLDMTGLSATLPGTLYNITAGSDIIGLTLNVGRNIGNIVTGLSALAGTGPREGDFRFATFEVGGSIGMMDVRGGLGIDQDNPPVPFGYGVDFRSSITFRTGLGIATDPSLRGDVGFIRIGSSVGGGTFDLTTPANSVVGGFVTDQDLTITSTGPYDGIYNNNPLLSTSTGLGFSLGFNSDLRFFDTPQIDYGGINDKFLPLVPGQPLSLTDDGGANVTLFLNAATAGRVIVMPIDGSLGVAIGRIEANLIGGGTLSIVGTAGANGADEISIGNLVITGADAASGIAISGTAQVDIWRIQQVGGEEFGAISNTSKDGDIVAADVQSLTNLVMGSGSLGRTQMFAYDANGVAVPLYGPKLIGPFLGVTDDSGTTGAGAPIVVPAGVVAPLWNGDLYRPVNEFRRGIPPGAWLDDVGSPVNPFLNGIIVRTGNVPSITTGGAVGDIVLNDQDGGGLLGQLIVNIDSVTPIGRFDGIVGTIYASRIASIDVGDGLQHSDHSPLPTTGIFANDDINTVQGGRIAGAFISGIVSAANVVPGNADALFPTDGVNFVTLSGGGSFVDAWIGATKLDTYWFGLYTGLDADPEPYTGRITQIIGTNANLLRTQVWADNITLIQLNSGFYDASVTRVRTNLDTLVAQGYRNSTVSGNQSEFFPNQVFVGARLSLLTTTARAGDVDDLNVDVLGTIGEVSGFHISRSRIEADIEISTMFTVGDFRGSTVVTGLLRTAQIGDSVRSSQILVSGPLVSLTVTQQFVNSSVEVSGPDGRLDTMTVQKDILSSSISVAGPIGIITAVQGDFTGRIFTTNNLRNIPGNINTLRAGRDIDLDADIGGTVQQVIAGRHFGSRVSFRSFVVHGDMNLIDISQGQMYSDIRIDQQLTGFLRIGAVSNKPGADLLGSGSLFVFGRINAATIEGDFGGRIVSYSGGIGTVAINNGSLLQGGAVQAFDGDIGAVIINSGHLLGDVHADYILYLVQVNASADGTFGDIGINPTLSQGVSYNSLRNQLPPGVVPNTGVQGPRITAGFNIGRIELNNGSIFEAFIQAGRAIGTITVAGDIRNDTLTTSVGTVIAAGSSIFLVTATGSISDTIIMAGVRSFGNDGRPGGVGANADTIQSGRIETITAAGNGTNVFVTAGMNAGNDGVYNTGDETVVLGISYVRTVTFGSAASNVSVFADSQTLNVSPGVVRAGNNFPLADADLSDGSAVSGGLITPGVPFGFNLPGGITGSITFTGPGTAYFDITARRVILINTSLASTVQVDANGTLTDFDIVTNDDASMGSITVTAPLAGDSDIAVDAYCLAINIGNFTGTGTVKAGMNVRSIVTGSFTGGNIVAAFWARDIVINGNYGVAGVTGEVRIDVLAGNSITVNGTMSGLVNVDRDLGGFAVNGAMNEGQFRAGNSVGGFTTGALSKSRVSAGDHFGPITVNGDVTESNIQSGGDLGADAAPGGTGFNADRSSSGNIASVRVVGNFTRSSIAAGMLRGPDGYFGTADDIAAAGRSNLGTVTITGTQVGSNLGSESFGVSATGTIAGVTLGGQNVTNVGNFRVEAIRSKSNPLLVQDVVITQSSLFWFATFYFNQTINLSTFLPSLTVSEVRDGGLTLVPLVQGQDYVLEPTTFKDRAVIRFARTVTDRALIPQGGNPGVGQSTPGTQDPVLPGPGVFRFQLSSDTFRATVNDARLDADPSTPEAESYSSDFVVGDAGDKFNPQVINTGQTDLINMYGAADLDVVLDNNFTPDGQPEANVRYIVRGGIGDHPDHNVNDFRPAADIDLYRITLRAGQILRLGAMQGAANNAGRFLLNSVGTLQQGNSPDTYDLLNSGNGAGGASFLVKTTGTYFIVLSNVGLGFLSSTDVPNRNAAAGEVGDYNFSVEIFDDFDTGFGAATDSGNGTNVVDAPQAILFAGNNGVFEPIGDPNSDDLSEVLIGDFRFTLDRNTFVVSGQNTLGITSTRNGTSLTSVISSAIGPRGHAGVPGDLAPDADVYLLNNGQVVNPGTTYTITLNLADVGADLGTFDRTTARDFRGSVQFGVFDVTDATAVDDGALVFSPTDFKSIAQKQRQISQQGAITYGYDAKGNFTITFVTPGRIGGLATDPAVYAVYLQGVFNTDYSITVQRTENAPAAEVPTSKQNFFIETRGGVIDWLQAGGLKTTVAPFAAGVLGFSGSVGLQSVTDYVLSQLVVRLNSIFTGNGLNVVFSTDPAAFEFEDFSRVFVTSTTDPISIFTQQNFGYSEHSDPYNSDRNDEAVVFLPSFGQLGFSTGQADIDEFVLSLTAAVGRRAGELMGLRLESDQSTAVNPNSIMRANSVLEASINAGYTTSLLSLSDLYDSTSSTNFFLGKQNAFALLDKFLTP